MFSDDEIDKFVTKVEESSVPVSHDGFTIFSHNGMIAEEQRQLDHGIHRDAFNIYYRRENLSDDQRKKIFDVLAKCHASKVSKPLPSPALLLLGHLHATVATPPDFDKAAEFYYATILSCKSKYYLAPEHIGYIAELATEALEDLAKNRNCLKAKELLAKAKKENIYRYSRQKIQQLLQNANNNLQADNELAKEFYESTLAYPDVSVRDYYYSSQGSFIFSVLSEIFNRKKEGLADIYLLILAAFSRENSKTPEQQRRVAAECYDEVITRLSPWTAEALYRRGKRYSLWYSLRSSEDVAQIFWDYCSGYDHAKALKLDALAEEILNEIRNLISQQRINGYIYSYCSKDIVTRAKLHKLEIMGLIHVPDPNGPRYAEAPAGWSYEHFRDLQYGDDGKKHRIEIVSLLCAAFLQEIALQHHTPKQLELLLRYIQYQLFYIYPVPITPSEYTDSMKKFNILNGANFTFENNMQAIKSCGDETPLQLLLNQAAINLRQVFELIRQGADKNTKNRAGDSLLHIAAKNNWPWVTIEMLLIAGLDPNRMNQKGDTLLHILASQRKNEMMQDVAKVFHADPTISDQKGQTAEQIFTHASHWWTIVSAKLGIETTTPKPSALDVSKSEKAVKAEKSDKAEKANKSEKIAPPLSPPQALLSPPSFGSYDDVSAMKADAQAASISVEESRSVFGSLAAPIRFFANVMDRIDNVDNKSSLALQSHGNGMMVRRNTLPNPTLVDPNRLIPSQRKQLLSEEVDGISEEEMRAKQAHAKRLAELEIRSEAERLAKLERDSASQQKPADKSEYTSQKGSSPRYA